MIKAVQSVANTLFLISREFCLRPINSGLLQSNKRGPAVHVVQPQCGGAVVHVVQQLAQVCWCGYGGAAPGV